MTETIDSIPIKVSRVGESCGVVSISTPEWENQEFKQKVRNLGIVRTWTVECFEDNVTWANSVAKYCEDKAKADTVVVLNIDIVGLAILCEVYILGVEISYDVPTNHRTFVLTLQEKT